MKKIRSLVAAFTLATASMVGLSSAEAQTVPVTPQGTYATTETAYVSQQAINDVAYNIGVQTPYYRAGVGFTEAYASTGEHIGLEFTLNGGTASVARAYNMNNPSAAAQFNADLQNAANTEANIASSGAYYGYQAAPRYEVVPSVGAIIGLGWIIHEIGRDNHHYYDNRRYEAPRHYEAPRREEPRRYEAPRREEPRHEQPRYRPVPQHQGGHRR